MGLPAPGAERKKELRSFCRSAGIRFKSLELLNLSLTHRSVTNESKALSRAGPVRANNERLEFLGDAVLGAVAVSLLYQRFPEKNEGELAKIKSVVVSEEILSGMALELGLDTALLLGKGEEQTGGRTKKAILADALEALIGALYLDSGFRAARDFAAPRINPEIDRVLDKKAAQDNKSRLQELSQRLYKAYPVYRLVKRTGPEHERLFWVEVTVNGTSYGPCTGR
ncbi:MAG: ribonuclease III, partial [Spirochaetaceae bacterium]|nr:ribonuclease III [Spirochaetaceae bacterium]